MNLYGLSAFNPLGTNARTVVVCASAIQTAFFILQSGIVDRENKSELKKLREVMERLEGEPSGIIDI